MGQGFGRLEAKLRDGQSLITSEAVARWAWLLNVLEALRARASWLLARPRFVEPLLERIEGSWLYRIATVVTTFAAFIVVVGAVVSGLVFLLFEFVL